MQTNDAAAVRDDTVADALATEELLETQAVNPLAAQPEKTSAAEDLPAASVSPEEAEDQTPLLTDEDMPAVPSLTAQSDLSVFFNRGVSAALRKKALRHVFSLPVYNERDGLNDYDDDFTKFEPLGDTVTSDMKWHKARKERDAEEAAEREAEARRLAEEEAQQSQEAEQLDQQNDESLPEQEASPEKKQEQQQESNEEHPPEQAFPDTESQDSDESESAQDATDLFAATADEVETSA